MSNSVIQLPKQATTAHTETWAEREQRLAEGRSHPTAWPLRSAVAPDDGLTIPEPQRHLDPARAHNWGLLCRTGAIQQWG